MIPLCLRVILFAKTSKALRRLNKMFSQNKIHKTYWAIVKNKPPEFTGELIHWLRKNEQQNKSYAYNSQKKVPRKPF